MVTAKKTIKATKAPVLKFDPKWIVDPGPEGFKGLDKSVVKEIAQAKKEFATRMKEILAKGQQR
jgi:lipid II:glycine glycyltransferase (peptidoglycan interpeptide bridge formation enzyme)